MIHFEPKDLPRPKVHQYMLGGIGPRPIALVSTLSKDGIPNLTPFSFFNCFGSNPPIIAFSPSRRGRNATLKDTYYNLMDTKECVVQSVTYPMIEQVSFASSEFPPEVNEFEKSGLTPIPSELVKPFRVKESPFQMECKLREMHSFGEGGGSANMAICEVLKFHVAEDIIENGIIQPKLIDLVARMSSNFYCHANGDAIFEVEKPSLDFGIGYDQLPNFMKVSKIYTGNDLGKFASIQKIPADDDIENFINEIKNKNIDGVEFSEEAFYRYQKHNNYEKMLKAALKLADENHSNKKLFLELTAKCAIENNNKVFAWNTALYVNKI